MDKEDILKMMYYRDFRRRLHEKLVEASIFGNEDEYLCNNFFPNINHTEENKETGNIKLKPYVPYLATLVKTMSSFYVSCMTDFLIDEILLTIEELQEALDGDK